jgi:hypothetical protein
MAYKGRVKNGVIVVDESASLPEGAEVEILLPGQQGPEIVEEAIPTLYEQFKGFVGIIKGLPSDLSENHDHYLYGCPKK